MPDDELLTSAQAELLVKPSARTIRRHAAANKLPYVQKLAGSNGDYLFERSVILAAYPPPAEDVAA